MTLTPKKSASPPPSFPFPVLDLTDLDSPDTAATFRAALLKATHEVGFFYLTGTGVSPELEERLLSAARAFFSLPEAEKLEIENIKRCVGVGGRPVPAEPSLSFRSADHLPAPDSAATHA